MNLWLPAASTGAVLVDRTTALVLAITGFFAAGIAAALLFLAWRYREGSGADRRPGKGPVWLLEAAWIVVPLVLLMGIFYQAAWVFFELRQPPAGALEVFVVGKRWMWKLQHPGGRREINELHVPKGVPVKLVMTSQDVIHSFYIPAFRIKQDVLPGRYTTLWFEATRAGRYRLFCAEYCGTDHSGMVGRVTVLEPAEYERWLQSPAAPSGAGGGLAVFERSGCATCHRPGSDERAPRLEGLFGSPVRLADGRTVRADEAYLRESVLEPAAKLVAGYRPLMPSYRGQLADDELGALVGYLRGLGEAKP